MNLPTSQFLPTDDQQLPPARRRQQRRRILPSTTGERSALLHELSHRLTPSLDYFIITLIAAVVLATAMLLDQPALFVLAALMAPFLAPAVGLSLAAIVGSVKFFLRSLGAFIIGSGIIFIIGCVAGWLSTKLSPTTYTFALQHAHFSWADFVLLSVGTILTVYMLVRSRQSRPLVTGAALAYELYLPIGVAGFGLAGNIAGLWPDGLIVFAVHLAWSALIGTLTLAVFGLRPSGVFGYTLGTSLILVSIIAVIIISGVGTAVSVDKALPPLPPTRTRTATIPPTITQTPIPPKPTPSPTNTLIPSKTATITLTPLATPIYARIRPNEYGGAVVRENPDFTSLIVKHLSNEMLVIVLDEYVQVDNETWVKNTYDRPGPD